LYRLPYFGTPSHPGVEEFCPLTIKLFAGPDARLCASPDMESERFIDVLGERGLVVSIAVARCVSRGPLDSSL
jgi:hypothetical protein